MSTQWKIRDLLWVFGFAFALIVLVILLRDFIFYLGGDTVVENVPYQSLIALFLFFLQNVIFLVPLYFFTVRKYGSTLHDFGFRPMNVFKMIGYVIAAYVLFIFINIVLFSVFFSFGVEEIPGYQPQKPYLPLFGEDAFSLGVAIAVVIFIAPVVEEVFFRGFVLQTLISRVNVFSGSILAALIFALFHFEFQSLIPIFILALILNALFLRTRSLYPGICFHVLNNSFALFAEYAIRHGLIPVEMILFS